MCIFCGSALPTETIRFRDLCAACGKDLHCCMHCAFYKPGAYRDCAETVPDAVADKARMNYCEYFKPNSASVEGSVRRDTELASKSAFDKLFN